MFNSFDHNKDAYTVTVYRKNSDGTDLEVIAENGRNPKWSPDGTQIAFEYEGQNKPDSLAIISDNGSNFEIIWLPCTN